MKKVLIFFDVDGTLRCNHTPTCTDPNPRVVQLLKIMARMKNSVVCVWSAAGKEYSEQFVRLFDLTHYVTDCYDKLDDRTPIPDIAIDDQQEFSMGKINLIVRAK